MPLVHFFVSTLIVPWMIVVSQINFHFTDQWNHSMLFQHHCLRLSATIRRESDPYELDLYCLGETAFTPMVEDNAIDPFWTFAQLHQHQISAEELLQWSAPIDLVERYQKFVDRYPFVDTHDEIFYNCTPPRFGPFCQFSLQRQISDFYETRYQPTEMTCYTHLACQRGSARSCLDWSEICDGYVDCANNAIDEENCWLIEIQECGNDEYRCRNGQCIPKVFVHDDPYNHECLDQSDENSRHIISPREFMAMPTFATEEVVCSTRSEKFSWRLTSSCHQKRHQLLKTNLFLDQPPSLSDLCWNALRCVIGMIHPLDSRCLAFCPTNLCHQFVMQHCPTKLLLPSSPLLFGHIYLGYVLPSNSTPQRRDLPPYMCYNERLCGSFFSNETPVTIANYTCRRLSDRSFPPVMPGKTDWTDTYLQVLNSHLSHCNTIRLSALECDHRMMYQCRNSTKCISVHRLCDGIIDCDDKDDERCSLINGTCSNFEFQGFFQCQHTNTCISMRLVDDARCDCRYGPYGSCEDEVTETDSMRKHISFPIICDGFTDLYPIDLNGWNETDETHCDFWQCNNTYTRCDGFWNCWNGADEVNCPSLWPCPSNSHACVAINMSSPICLPLEQANDGRIDCIGATDEPQLCRSKDHVFSDTNFYCGHGTGNGCSTMSHVCLTNKVCSHGFNQSLCHVNQSKGIAYTACAGTFNSIRSSVQTFLCQRPDDRNKRSIVHFSLRSPRKQVEHASQNKIANDAPPMTTAHPVQRCHRGFPMELWLDVKANRSRPVCLCPPNYYGDRCQYQNQRVSLTMRLQTFSDCRRKLFSLLITLIDNSDQRRVHSYERLTYLYVHHCRKKFNVYLLYSSRPKHPNRDYAIHIDIYEKVSLAYRGSFLLPIRHSFLPVHRLAVQLDIPRSNDVIQTCTDQPCVHGRCLRYMPTGSDSMGSFCQCDRGWSGKQCHIPYHCECSSDSICMGITAENRSICLCPWNKCGTLCSLRNTACESHASPKCYNHGQCVPINDNLMSENEFVCQCPKGFSGPRCEITNTKISLSFHRDISLPTSALMHFIEVIDNGPPENGSTFKTISMHQQTLIVDWPRSFHIAFVEFFPNNYYLAIVQETYTRSMNISRTIAPSDRCPSIRELLNETIVEFHLLHRIKYYHVPCQNRSLQCFYDDEYFCLCLNDGDRRVANCFEYNTYVKHDCSGQSSCENGAQCFQDRSHCPQTSICLCRECFYGTRCQFTSHLFAISLDDIIGYYIRPKIILFQQPFLIKLTIIIASAMIMTGFINGILTFITFIRSETRKVGCGIYLLSISVTTLLTTVMLMLKIGILLFTQINTNSSRSFLEFQCLTLDFLLRIGSTMDRWLSACVSIERSVSTIAGVSFNRAKSKYVAKYVLFLTFVLVTITHLHDPFHRRLLDDEDDERVWCVVTYSYSFQVYNRFIAMFHFFVPFAINLITTIIITVSTARQRTPLTNHRSYRYILLMQFQRHRHLLITPIILILLAIPGLFIAFVSGCLKSKRSVYPLLFGYLISLKPSFLCFLVFVLPSQLYREQCRKSCRSLRRHVCQRAVKISVQA